MPRVNMKSVLRGLRDRFPVTGRYISMAGLSGVVVAAGFSVEYALSYLGVVSLNAWFYQPIGFLSIYVIAVVLGLIAVGDSATRVPEFVCSVVIGWLAVQAFYWLDTVVFWLLWPVDTFFEEVFDALYMLDAYCTLDPFGSLLTLLAFVVSLALLGGGITWLVRYQRVRTQAVLGLIVVAVGLLLLIVSQLYLHDLRDLILKDMWDTGVGRFGEQLGDIGPNGVEVGMDYPLTEGLPFGVGAAVGLYGSVWLRARIRRHSTRGLPNKGINLTARR